MDFVASQMCNIIVHHQAITIELPHRAASNNYYSLFMTYQVIAVQNKNKCLAQIPISHLFFQ